jgi:hypothetical protein
VLKLKHIHFKSFLVLAFVFIMAMPLALSAYIGFEPAMYGPTPNFSGGANPLPGTEIYYPQAVETSPGSGQWRIHVPAALVEEKEFFDNIGGTTQFFVFDAAGQEIELTPGNWWRERSFTRSGNFFISDDVFPAQPGWIAHTVIDFDIVPDPDEGSVADMLVHYWWEVLAEEFHVIEFFANGGSLLPPASIFFPAGRTFPAPTQGSLTHGTLNFLGWSRTPGATEADLDYAPGDMVVMGDATLNLYAVWGAATITNDAITITAPVRGETPVVAAPTGGVQWSATTIEWFNNVTNALVVPPATFTGETVYRAQFTITPSAGWTMPVANPGFTVADADTVTRAASPPYLFTVVFPATAAEDLRTWNATVTGEGTLVASSGSAAPGGEVILTLTERSGYNLTAVAVAGTGIVSYTPDLVARTVTFTMPAGAGTLDVVVTPTWAPDGAPPAAPSFIDHPDDVTVPYGETTATFTATAVGSPTPDLQWQYSIDGGTTWVNVVNDPPNFTGATTGTLELDNVDPDMDGHRFRLVATNEIEGITERAYSEPATLTVQTAPPTFSLVPNQVTLTNANPQTVTAVGTASGAITVGALVPANANISVTPIATGVTVQFTGAMPSAEAPAAITSGPHDITVSRQGEEAPLRIYVNIPAFTPSGPPPPPPQPVPPTITGQPVSVTRTVGQTATFTVTAVGDPVLTYRWQTNTINGWTDMPGETDATLTLPNVTLAMHNNQYRVVVNNDVGPPVTSNTVTLSVTAVQPPPQPPGLTGGAWRGGGFVQRAPSAPRSFTAAPSDGQIALSWAVPADRGQSDIIRYELSRDGGRTWAPLGNVLTHTVTGLTNGSRYTFILRAVNNQGNGAQARVTAMPNDRVIAPVPAPVITAPVLTPSRFVIRLDSFEIIDSTGRAQTQVMDVLPVLENGRVLIPIRFVADALGARTDWNAQTSEVTISRDWQSVTFAIGQMIDGMDVPAQIINERTFVPLRFVSEFFGAQVFWDESDRSVEIVR